MVVVSGTSPIDQSYLASARRDFQQFEGQVEFTYLTDLPLEEIERRVSELPEHSIVFYVTLYRDSAGHPFAPGESAGRIGKAANAPFYSFAEAFTTPAGGVGGYLWSLDADAMEVSKTARRILAGTKPQDIPIHVGDSNRYIFDWRQLRRWGIDEKRLPPGSIVTFKEPTFWEQYKWHTVGVVSLSILEALLIVGLLINRSRRRQAEERNELLAGLAKAEHQRLNEVISNVPGIVWESRSAPGTNRRTASFVSEHVEKMLGYSVEEWLSTPGFAITIVAEEDRERVTRESQAVLESGKDGVLQFRWVTKDGRILWVESEVAVIHDETGKPVGLRGVTMDVTDRKVAEAGLKDSEAQLAGVISSAMDAIISIDESQNVVLFNSAAEKMFSCSAREAIGQPLDRFIPERFRAAHKDHIRMFGQTNVTKRSMGALIPIYGRRATGEDFPIEASISQVELNGQNFYTVILRDITERLRAEEALRQSEHRFRNMADTAPVLIWISGPDKLCTYFNQGWLEFTGRTMEQELGNGWAEGVYSEDYAGCMEIYNTAFDSRELFKMEYRLRGADGVFRWIYDIGTPRFASEGEFLGYIGSCIDISERKRAELEAMQQRSELAHLSRVAMLGELSGSMAHELNQPLTAILSNAQAAQRFLAHDDVDLDEVRDILTDIVDQDNRAGEVIRRLRLLLKKGEVQQQPLDANDLVQEVLKLIRSDLANQSVTASTNFAPDQPTVTGDRVQLQQVLLNLLMNASDAMSGNARGDRQVLVSTELCDGAGVRFSVSDRGAGIAVERLEQIFEPFFTTKTHGLGLGLSVCRTIISAHGGKLWAVNNPERGATFHFTLPAERGNGMME